jgi:hypothetical protein
VCGVFFQDSSKSANNASFIFRTSEHTIDLIAPRANAENKLAGIMLTDLQRTALNGRSFKFQRTHPVTGKRDVIKVGG